MKKTWTYLKAVLFTLGAILPFYIGYDVLFSQPKHLQGTIVEKIFVPAHGAVGGSPFWGAHRGNYVVTVKKQEQWIAVVKMDSGDTLSVHCFADHYNKEQLATSSISSGMKGSTCIFSISPTTRKKIKY